MKIILTDSEYTVIGLKLQQLGLEPSVNNVMIIKAQLVKAYQQQLVEEVEFLVEDFASKLAVG